jgi:hypothetical protein
MRASAARGLGVVTAAAAAELAAATAKARARAGTGVDLSESGRLGVLSKKWMGAAQGMLEELLPSVQAQAQGDGSGGGGSAEDGGNEGGEMTVGDMLTRLNISAKVVGWNARRGEFDKP